MPDESTQHDVDEFVKEKIDTVPHLEALLLLWNSRPKPWSPEEMGKALFLKAEATREILQDLVRQRLIVPVADADDTYTYNSEPEKDALIACVDATYRQELIRLTALIHSKPSAAVRAFAKAFRLTRNHD